jgi:hypothetical protein
MDRPGVRPAKHCPLDAAMLVSQGDLQVIDRLTVTLKTEMSRLDDPGVHRADGHFVHFVTGHLEKVRFSAAEQSASGMRLAAAFQITA